MRLAQSNKSGGEFIKTYVRIKPTLMDELSLINCNNHEVIVNRSNHEPFEYNEVFGESCKNQYIFETVMMPIISHMFDGYNACILAYGQTSSGKTYTMKGVEENMGLIPLAIREIFRRIKKEDMVAKLRISYFEIYNENIIDLLSKDQPPRYLEVRDDFKKNAVIQELIEEEVTNQDDSLSFYDQGETRRKFACNNINFSSSRSHTVFRICMEVAHQDLTTSISTISMVDLAGSESISKTNAVGLLRKESQNINKSLLALSNVIRTLSQRNNYVNFRDSRLTRILQPCLTGYSKTVVICTISQSEDCVGESINTLKFGVAANSIKINVQKNTVSQVVEGDPKYEQLYTLLEDERAEKYALHEEIIRLNSQIARHKQYESNRLNEINDLKHRLNLEQNQNSNTNLLLNQLKGQRDKQEERNGYTAHQIEESIKVYKTQIGKLQLTVGQMKDKLDTYKRINEQLERNEKTLLDRLAKYERELSVLQKTINTKEKETVEEATMVQSYKRPPAPQATKKSDNPYTLSKVIQLSTRILDIKIQLNQYMRANAELQEENERLAGKVEFIEKNCVVVEEDNLSQVSQVSQKSKVTRQSGETKYKDWQARNLKEQVKKLKNEKECLQKKIHQMRTILKRNANNHIEELHGFNRFVDKNFTAKEREYFQFLLEEDPNDFDPISREQSLGSESIKNYER